MENLNFPSYTFFVRNNGHHQEIFDTLTQEYVALTPEEWVRQHLVQYLVQEKDMPAGLMRREVPITLGRLHKRADIVVYNRQVQPVLVAECKAPNVKLRQSAFDQVALYNKVLRAPFVTVTNGLTHHFCAIDHMHRMVSFHDELPSYEVACRYVK